MRGRPPSSKVRKEIAAILKEQGFAYGYEIYKMHKINFNPVSLRNIYYNLKKGVKEREFMVFDIKKEPGKYTWGNETEHIYYGLGPYYSAENIGTKEIAGYNKREINIDYKEEINKSLNELYSDIENFLADSDKIREKTRKKEANIYLNKINKIKGWITSKIDEKEKDLILLKLESFREQLRYI